MVLNLLIQEDDKAAAIKRVDAVGAKLSANKINHEILSLNFDDGKSNASLSFKKKKTDVLALLTELTSENPDIQFDYYSR